MGVRSGQGTSSSVQAARSAKRFAPTVPASSSQKWICSSSQIANLGTTSTEDAMAKFTVAGPIIHEIDEHGDNGRTLHQLTHWSQPLRMLSLEKEKYSGFHKSQTSIVEKESKFTDFEEKTREVEGNKGESAGGENGVKKEEEEKAEGELSWGNSRVREELEEDHDEVEIEMQDADEVQCCEHLEIEMQGAELAEYFIALPANQPSVHHVDIPSLAKEDAIPSKPALVSFMTTPKRPPNPAYHFSFSGTSLLHSAHLVTVTSADQTVPTNFPLQGAIGAASAAAADPACSGQALNNVTQQSHLHEISKKSRFLEFEVSPNAFPILMQIQQRFSETFTSFKIKRSEWAVPMLGNLAEFGNNYFLRPLLLVVKNEPR